MFNQSAAEVLNSYFDKIIVLSIARNSERIKTIDKVLHGLNFEIFYGVDGKDLKYEDLLNNNEIVEDINSIFIDTSLKHMNMVVNTIHINEIACALSHRKIYEYIVNNNLNKVLIFEDDVIPVFANLKFLPETISELPNQWDVLYLGYLINNDFSFWGRIKYSILPKILFFLGLKTSGVLRKIKSYPKSFSKNLKKQGGHVGLHSYAITNSAANKLLKTQRPVKFLADLLMMEEIGQNKLKSYTSKRIFFEQNQSLHSSIWEK